MRISTLFTKESSRSSADADAMMATDEEVDEVCVGFGGMMERQLSMICHGSQDVLECFSKNAPRLYVSPPGCIVHAVMMMGQWRRVLDFDGS